MENKDYSTAVSVAPLAPVTTGQEGLSVASTKRGFASWKLLLGTATLLVGLIVAAVIGYQRYRASQESNVTAVDPVSVYAIQKLDLAEMVADGDLGLATSQSLSVNGQLRTNNSLVLTPTTRPTSGTAGQLYYDQTANGLAYYDGSDFIALAAGQDITELRTQLQGVQAVVSTLPSLSIPSDLATLGVQNTFQSLNSFNGGITTTDLTVSDSATLQGGLAVTGPVTLGATTMSSLLLSSPLGVSSGGTGSTSLTNNGILIGQGSSPITAVAAGGPNLCLMSTAGAPAFSACPGAGGSDVSSLNALTGDIVIANTSGVGTVITIDDASTSAKGIASFNAANFVVTNGAVNTVQDISVTASPTFGNLTAATLTGGGAGITNLSANNIATGTLADGRLSANVALLGGTNNFTGTLQQSGNAVCTAANNCNYLTGASADGSYIQLQVGTPGTPQTGHFNISGTGIANALTAVTLAGNGTAVTNVNAAQLNSQAPSYYLNATNINAGSLNDARLSANVALLNAATVNFSGTLQRGGNAVCDASNNCNYLTGSAANGAYIQLQVSTPGVAQTGHFNISGTGRAVALYQNGNQVCDTTGNCAGLGGGLTGAGTTGAIAKFTATGNLGDSLLSESGSAITVGGDLFATTFSGNGAAVTNVNAAQLGGQAAGYYLNATNITAGTLGDARLSSNVTLQGNTFNGSSQLVQLNGTGQLPALSGALLTSLNGSSISSGTVADARLSANIPLLGAGTNNFTGTLQQGGNNVCTTAGNCPSSGVTTVGALGGGTPSADGATISGTTIYLQSASESYAGLVNTSAQSFVGVKTLTSGAVISADQSLVLSSSSGNASLLSVGGLNGNALTVDTSASTGSMRVSIGVPSTCTVGRFCVNQGAIATSGGGPFTNIQNVLDVNRTSTTAISFTGQRIKMNDVTSTAVANNLYGIVIDSRTGTTNNSALVNGFMSDISSSHAGNFLWLQHNGSTDVFTVTNSGNLTTTGTSLFRGTSNTIRTDSATAFVVQNTSSTALLTADTSTMKVTVRSAEITFNLTVNGHIISGGSAPTLSLFGALCAGGLSTVTGTDTAGLISLRTATTCSGTGKLATLNFGTAYGAAPRVVLTPANAAASALNVYVDSATISTSAFEFGTTTTPSSSTTYNWYYQVIQ